MNTKYNSVFTLRLDNEILTRVKQSAQENKRSAAKEIEYALGIYYSTLKTK